MEMLQSGAGDISKLHKRVPSTARSLSALCEPLLLGSAQTCGCMTRRRAVRKAGRGSHRHVTWRGPEPEQRPLPLMASLWVALKDGTSHQTELWVVSLIIRCAKRNGLK